MGGCPAVSHARGEALMSAVTTQILAGFMGVLALGAASAAGASVKGVVPADSPAHVATVEVVEAEATAPSAFAVALREAVIRQAALYGDAGRPIALKVELQRVHFKNPVKAMLIGDDNQAKGQVSIVDVENGQQTVTFKVRVDAERGGAFGQSIAEAIVGALDPTGVVDWTTAVGHAASANINYSGTASNMIANFASETLRQTFGDTRTKAVRLAQKQAQKLSRAKTH